MNDENKIITILQANKCRGFAKKKKNNNNKIEYSLLRLENVKQKLFLMIQKNVSNRIFEVDTQFDEKVLGIYGKIKERKKIT